VRIKLPLAFSTLALALFFLTPAGRLLAADLDAGKIMRPVDGAALPTDQADIIATAPRGKLELDGRTIQPQEPFPNVFHAVIKVSPGVHTLSLLWDGGKKEIKFFSGANPPSGFTPFFEHPPLPNIPCTQCHEVNQHGRFRFKGGCFGCHQEDSFTKFHAPHSNSILNECGLCHNAHGSTAKALLLFPKDVACRQCHD
jgi:predicted CXXCH cytochrome family protein